jgi:endonuclease/exonuclease/phosphatase family metal-dependent hydrolase
MGGRLAAFSRRAGACERRETTMPDRRPLLPAIAAALLIGAGCGRPPSAQPRPAWLAGTAPVVAGGPGTGAPLLVAGAGRPAATGAVPLDVLSYNMKHKDRPAELAVVADALEQELDRLPDFILCQEVVFERDRRKGPRNTAAVLADALGYHCRGTKRTSDREGVAIISRYPFEYYEARQLKARTAGLLLGFRRVSAMGEFQVPGVGRIRVVTVHFAYQNHEHHVRRKQLTETLQWIAEREQAAPANLTVLGGDFNMKPHWSELAVLWDDEITGGLRFSDFNGSNPTRGPQGRPNARIDYIFLAASGCDVRMLGEQLLFGERLPYEDGPGTFWLSDHLLVLHEYAVAGRPAGPTYATVVVAE